LVFLTKLAALLLLLLLLVVVALDGLGGTGDNCRSAKKACG